MEREIRDGESHTYPVVLESGQFLRVVVDQNGVDLVVRLMDPGGTPVLSVDSLTGTTGEEDCAAVAERTGLYRIEVSASPEADEGGYELRVEGPRSPSKRDRLRVEAVRAMEEAFAAREAPEQILARYEKALGLWGRLGERRRQAEMLFQVAQTLKALGQLERAAEVYAQAAGLWGKLGDRGMGDLRLQVEALNEAGILLDQKLAQWKEALARYEEALAVATEAENLGQQSAILHNLGRLARKRGDARAGVQLLQRSSDLARQIGKKALEAGALNSLGAAYMDLSDRQQALRSYEEALRICKENDDRQTESSVLNNLGDFYESLGEWEKALEYHDQSLALHHDLGDPTNEAITLNNMGVVYARLGETDKTLEFFGRALALVQKAGDKDLQARFLTNLAFVHLLRDEADKAQEASRRALELVGDRGDVEAARHALGSSYRLQGNHEAARAELEKALELSRERGNRSRQAEVILTLARLEKDRGDLRRALSLIQQSVEIVESLRTGVVSQDLRASFLASKQAHYELNIDILMALHAAEPGKDHETEALRVSEQARARSLLEILQQGGTDVQLQERSPRYLALTQPRPLHVEEIQSTILDGGALLLEYALGSEQSYLWAVTPESVESFPLPARNRIEEMARRYYGLLTTRSETLVPARESLRKRDAEAEQLAAELSGMILEPVRHLLKDRPLLIVADGALQYIPFAALPLPGTTTPLIRNHEVVNLPSASALAVLRSEARDRPAASRTLAVLADPVFQKEDPRLEALGLAGDVVAKDATHRGGAEREGETDLASFLRLSHSRREADAIAGLLPPDQTFKALDFDASRAVATSGRLAEYRNVHFATHGVVDSDRPERSSLVLSLVDQRGEPVDGFLRLNDIYNLELRADLVVLSACQTALGKEIRGEGLIGLTRGFMYAGAPRVLATLWSVDDLATARFMKHFYRAMLNQKLSPAAALRQAQIAMMDESKQIPPYYWAGFSLQGEWK